MLKDEHWASYTLPIFVPRNFTILGVAEKPVTLDMNFVRSKIRMGNGTTLTLQGVVMTNFRSGSFNQAPGLDLLAPLPPGEMSIVWANRGGIVIRACFPLAVALQAAAFLTRRPEALPGNNMLAPYTPASGCVNSTTAPALERCYVYGGRYVDVAATSYDLGPVGSPIANGYLIYATDVVVLCASVLSDECIARLGPLGCVLYTFSLSPTPSAPANQNESDAGNGQSGDGRGASSSSDGGPSEPTAVHDALPGGAGDSSTSRAASAQERRRLEAALGGALGGGLLLASTALAAVLLLRLRRRQQSLMRESLALGAGAQNGGAGRGVARLGDIAELRHVFWGSCCEVGCCVFMRTSGSGISECLTKADPSYAARRDSVSHGGQSCPAAAGTPSAVLQLDPGSQAPSGPDSDQSLISNNGPVGVAQPQPLLPVKHCQQGNKPHEPLEAKPGEEVDRHAARDCSDCSRGAAGGGGGRSAIVAAGARGGGGGVRHEADHDRLGSAPVVLSPSTPQRGDLQLDVRLVSAAQAPCPAGAACASATTVTGGSTCGVDHSRSGVRHAGSICSSYQAGGGTSTGTGTLTSGAGDGTWSSGAPSGRGGQTEAGAASADVVTLLPAVLGKGAFGRVYEGVYQGARVAVKVIRSDTGALGGFGCPPPEAQPQPTRQPRVSANMAPHGSSGHAPRAQATSSGRGTAARQPQGTQGGRDQPAALLQAAARNASLDGASSARSTAMSTAQSCPATLDLQPDATGSDPLCASALFLSMDAPHGARLRGGGDGGAGGSDGEVGQGPGARPMSHPVRSYAGLCSQTLLNAFSGTAARKLPLPPPGCQPTPGPAQQPLRLSGQQSLQRFGCHTQPPKMDTSVAAPQNTAPSGAQVPMSPKGGAPARPQAAAGAAADATSRYGTAQFALPEAGQDLGMGTAERRAREQEEADSHADLFAAEVAVLGRCDHPNVVRLLAACLTPPRLCLVMERCETSLEHMIYGADVGQQPTLIPLNTLLHIAIQICQGLEYLHPTIVHRDLKPANVLINGSSTARPVAKLADFGLARIREMTLPTINPEAGTPAYVAPECYELNNDMLTHRVDMYALGVLLWAMLTGQRPWKGYSVVAVAYKVAVLRERLPLEHLPVCRCPPKLRNLIRQCWEADPRRRPAAAEAVKTLALVLEALGRADLSTNDSLLSSVYRGTEPGVEDGGGFTGGAGADAATRGGGDGDSDSSKRAGGHRGSGGLGGCGGGRSGGSGGSHARHTDAGCDDASGYDTATMSTEYHSAACTTPGAAVGDSGEPFART